MPCKITFNAFVPIDNELSSSQMSYKWNCDT